MPGRSRTDCSRSALDTLWYIDPESGLDGVWDNSLASDKPIYNADFTEMTVKLRKGIYWSDGVEFTAADVKATVDIQAKNPAMRFGAVLANNVAAVETPDPYTVVFKLKKPNSRFHANFTVRWAGIWILPKHVFEKVEDPAQVRLQQAGLARRLHAAQLRSRRQMVHLAAARRLAAHHASAASASPARNTSPMSIRARRTSASSRSSTTNSTSCTTSRPRACSPWQSRARRRAPGSRASRMAIPIRRCRR